MLSPGGAEGSPAPAGPSVDEAEAGPGAAEGDSGQWRLLFALTTDDVGTARS